MEPTVKTPIAYLIEGSLGDSLIALPTLQLLFRHLPENSVALLSLDEQAELAAANILRGRFPFTNLCHIQTPRGAGLLQKGRYWYGVVRQLKRWGTTRCVYGIRPEGDAARSRAKRHRRLLRWANIETIGAAPEQVSESLAAELLPILQSSLAWKIFARTAKALSLDPDHEIFDFSLPLLSTERTSAETWKIAHNMRGKLYYCVCISAKQPSSRWPVARYVEVVAKLRQLIAAEPIFIGGPEDTSLHSRVINELGFGTTAAGLAVGATAALLAGARFYLGNDTGPMHLAAAVGCPCVAIFSARAGVGQWYPLGIGHAVLRKNIACQNCGLSVCITHGSECLMQISVSEVLTACTALANSPAGSQRLGEN